MTELNEIERHDRDVALLDALYDDHCIEPPQTDHITHILASLAKVGWSLEPLCSECHYPLRDWAGHACPGQ